MTFVLSCCWSPWAASRRGVSGESLAIGCATLIAKWASCGPAQAVLESVRTDVFNVSVVEIGRVSVRLHVGDVG